MRRKSAIPFEPAEIERYRRQLILPGWSEETQLLLKEATVFIAGAGGLGSSASIYLAAAGVGTLRICDKGDVELSNLNRQILHSNPDVGKSKVRSAERTLTVINPHLKVVTLAEEIKRTNISTLVGNARIMIDCLDNFPGRYVLNEYAVQSGIPLVHAGVYALSGQITFIQPPKTPCLACIVPEIPPAPSGPSETAPRSEATPPSEDTAPSEATPRSEATPPSEAAMLPPEAGIFPVLGAAVGILGSLEAMEAVKYLSGTGSLLKNRLLFIDGDTMLFQDINVARELKCPVCGHLPA